MKKQVLSIDTFKGFETLEIEDKDLGQIKGGIVIEEEIIG